jgi:hypothetical protein
MTCPIQSKLSLFVIESVNFKNFHLNEIKIWVNITDIDLKILSSNIKIYLENIAIIELNSPNMENMGKN